MSRFLDALKSGRVLLMDGAMGTELQRAGLKPGECGELWNLTHPEKMRAIHQAYVDAGAEVLLTNTFQANPRSLDRFGLGERIEDISRAAVQLAREANPSGFVLFDLGPWPARQGEHPEAVKWPWSREWFRRVMPLALEGADGLLLETFSRTKQVGILVRFVRGLGRRFRHFPILVSFAFRHAPEDGVCANGYEHLEIRPGPELQAVMARYYPLDGVGTNCGRDIGMEETIEVIHRYRDHTDLPLFARPNAGTPTRTGAQWDYPHTPEAMAARLPELLEAGVSMVGGCCGTTPAHIAAFRPVLDAWNARRA
jgi:5-methyltetrahydrofolate--homocysteine methyltransferase